MAIDRRTWLAGALSAWAATPLGATTARRDLSTIIASAIRARDGRFAAVLYDINAGLLRSVSLPGRGHDVAVRADGSLYVVFARRPGNFAIAFGADRSQPPIVFTTPSDRHFYGHGVIAPDGRTIYATENDFASGNGVIGVWRIGDVIHRVAEFPSYGIGPHDIAMLADGRTLVVANGGLRTHPDYGRKPLNLSSMVPSLAYIDANQGSLLEHHLTPVSRHQISLRHMAVGRGDTVVIGAQFKGQKTQVSELIGFHNRGGDIEWIATTPDVHRALRHYVSSISVDRSGTLAAATSSRGNALVRIDIAGRRIIDIVEKPDVSGVAAGAGSGKFIMTGGHGNVWRSDNPPGDHRVGWSWDNHAECIVAARG